MIDSSKIIITYRPIPPMLPIVYDKRFLELPQESLPESPERLKAIYDYLNKPDIANQVQFVAPNRISSVELEVVHSEEYIQSLQELSSKENQDSPDNPFYSNTFEIAKLSAASALTAAKLSLHGKFSFSLSRPPGHHAQTAKFSGFCYLNNIAFATRTLMLEEGLQKAMIIDFDVHHGDGTQQIFQADPSVFYLSLHQNPSTLFPFKTGFKEENNFHIRNIPLAPEIGDEQYLLTFKKTVHESVKEFSPELIAISAGFDSFYLDRNYVGSRLEIKNPQTYLEIGRILGEEADKCGAYSFAVLEGGYHIPKMGENCWSFLKAFA